MKASIRLIATLLPAVMIAAAVSSCAKNDAGDGTSGFSLALKGQTKNGNGVSTVFSGEDIRSFDASTGELVFMSEESAGLLVHYSEVTFELSGEPLFTLATVDSRDRFICGTLFLEHTGNRWKAFIAYDRMSAEWQEFIVYLRDCGKLEDSQDGIYLSHWTSETPGLVRITPLNSPVPFETYSGYVDIDPEKPAVIRCEEDFAEVFGTDRPSGIDYGRYTLIASHIYALNGIRQMTSALTSCEGGGYDFVTRLFLDDTEMVCDEPLLVLAEDLPEDAVISASVIVAEDGDGGGDDPGTGHDEDWFMYMSFSDWVAGTPGLWRITPDNSPAPFTAYVRYTDLESNTVYVIDSEEEFRSVLNTEKPSGVDFASSTLFVSRICMPSGIALLRSTLVQDEEGYRFTTEVTASMTDEVRDEPLIVVSPKIPDGADIECSVVTGM